VSTAMSSYPPPRSPRPTTGVLRVPLLPIYPHPAFELTPNAPIFARSFPDSRYIGSTHIVPAAHLRCTPLAESPPAPTPDTASKPERVARNVERVAWVKKQAQVQRGSYERVLWNTANRYVRKNTTHGDGAGITLFLAHANGLPKEVRASRTHVYVAATI
jgi:hypothetical protein